MSENQNNSEQSTLHNMRSIVMMLLIGILCVYAFMSNTGSDAQALPMIFGKGCAIVMTGSMEPTLPVDSLIIVSETGDYEVGDVIVIQDYYNLVVHRIVSIDENTVITKGDANNSEDEPMPVSSIRGEVVRYVPYVGACVRIMKTPLGTLILIAVVLVFWVFSNRNGNDEDEDDEENNNTEEGSDNQ